MKKLYFLVVLFVVGIVNAQNPDDIVYIPDANFKALLLQQDLFNTRATDVDGNAIIIDANNDSEIQVSEALEVYGLSANGNISSFLGIKSFANLKNFATGYTNVTEIDLSGMTNLESFGCSSSLITNLNLSGLTSLKLLNCASNNLTSLDLSDSINLEYLDCGANNLTGLDLSLQSNLKEMRSRANPITDLNLTGLTQLEIIDCSYNNLSNLNILSAVNVKELNVSGNSLTSLDVSHILHLESLDCMYNPITNINVMDLSNLTSLLVSDCPITTLNLQGLTSLNALFANNTSLAQLDVSGLNNLGFLYCSDGNITTLNLTGATSIIELDCWDNEITALDLTGLVNVIRVACSGNQIQYLDATNSKKLQYLYAQSNQLKIALLKNGMIALSTINISNNPDLKYVCVEESLVESMQQSLYLNPNCVVNSYCSFTPGGEFFTINGNNRFDTNNNGCDASDIALPNLKFNITNGTQTGSIIANQSGEYSIPVQEGTHTITPLFENPTFFNISPSTVSVTFPATTSPFTQNFCITPNGLHPDLEVAILPTTPARPGFDAEYKILIKNKGNIQQSVSVSFAYNDAVLDYVIAEPLFTTQAEGSLSWAFANLEPFETREINLTLNVNSPMETPDVNGDDVLTYTATITSEATDELPLDNTFSLPQIVVNSFDPNDKTCLEGTAISQSMIGQYVHYMIRFENTGTFAAENIVVKDMIDTAKFDVSSLVALNGSHPYVTRITGNKVEFIFEGINLPFDDATNDGYVVFKIKTLPTLALGDSFSNTASIYFDYNHPIVTEPAVTTFAELGREDFVFNNYFTIYPNPTSSILNISTKQAIEMQSISIYNILGQMMVAVPNAKGIKNVDVSSLSTGNYFIKIVSDKGTSNSKFIKQ
ncbi:MAG: T9SS type A sorting domain-containing protein [Flavobacterium sp.]|nr:MAG: T9SS type A sorting domain-containing protein [Flavobacterium sp.]